ncbi:MAG TPA: D-alanine--D-alanine ligase family protein [Clostridia bacterium]|nr:D-alanine--D-alanine ligase family protein [Clostridia bacterium]
MSNTRTVLVLFGGVSSEHDVSLISARSVIDNIPREKYKVLSTGITKDGRWFLYSGDSACLPGGKWLDNEALLTPALISPDRSEKSLVVFTADGVEKVPIDVVFPVLHGKNGEDGTIQGLLELAGIAFVGCDALSSAVCMDKAITNALADANHIAQARWQSFTQGEFLASSSVLLENAIDYLGFPIFVKPANTGSSVGVSKAKNESELLKAVESAFLHDKKVVLEQGIDGVEIECAVLGNESPFASIPGEVVPCNEFYDYDAKYVCGTSELHIPARLSAEKLAEVKESACRIFTILGCSGLARIDFFVQNSDGAVLLNEPNTIPGFTPISMYPKMLEASGIPYPALLDKLLCLAIEKWSEL